MGGRAATAFHHDLGYPIHLHTDAVVEVLEDEMAMVVHNFTRVE